MMKRACVLGSGSWGTALATVVAERGLDVALWSRDPEHSSLIAESRENKRFLPGVALPDSIRPTSDLAAAIDGADLILCVIPSTGVADLAEKVAAISPADINYDETLSTLRSVSFRCSTSSCNSYVV